MGIIIRQTCVSKEVWAGRGKEKENWGKIGLKNVVLKRHWNGFFESVVGRDQHVWMWGAGRGGVGLKEPAQWVAIILPASSAKVSGVNPSGVLEKSPQYTWIPFCPLDCTPRKESTLTTVFFLNTVSFQSSPSSSFLVSASCSGNYFKHSSPCCK